VTDIFRKYKEGHFYRCPRCRSLASHLLISSALSPIPGHGTIGCPFCHEYEAGVEGIEEEMNRKLDKLIELVTRREK
jgi:hypothetical protein